MKQTNIRNFAIIAHIDHGKSTLADRLLELTGTVPKEKMREQFLDQNPISRERGITIKLAPVRMLWHPKALNPKSEIRNKSEIQNPNNQNNFEFRDSNFEFANSEYILNLIDTPGHVDFSYEVSRTLAACEGVVLLIDATQGIQAQTVAHFNTAKKENLAMIPVINKIDLPNADILGAAKAFTETLGFKEEEIIQISAKTGQNIQVLLKRIIEKIPPPHGLADSPFRALIFDALYDEHRGVVVFIRVVDGEIKTGENIVLFQSGFKTKVLEVGYFSPYLTPKSNLFTGEVGYLVTGIKDIHKCNIGDTITISNLKSEPLPGYQKPKPMVFFGIYPKTTNEFVSLKEALERLSLKDASLIFSQEHSSFLGSGFKVGFLGLLHAEIVKERLGKEFSLEPLFTMPRISYQKKSDGTMLEPYMDLQIFAPKEYLGAIMSLCQKRKGKLLDVSYKTSYVILKYEMPYMMLVRGIASTLKGATSGFASLDYIVTGYKEAALVNLEIQVNNTLIDVLSEFVYRDEAVFLAREKVKKLKEIFPRQQFRQIIQAVVSGKIVAREEIPPFRKDVLKKLSGGDRTRKDKLLKKQKKGKARLFSKTSLNISQEALFSFFSKNG